ncbi:uncharacterized protein CcaverHIS019_0206720 [Cutaneotrichosporon cavernicola]|uniref:chitin synthase n=1 Tax=Cutaneotrichosporon cavernicola TaxID=279322 RepID=A0AA48I918_9TREE|nr:uncharacterized protein CcaverHIS019_0206720 [Cutaneotrichosporon cavernicola]BEI89310.1 hypothetical protein CcaverHIS019_0206720 [Cutaneotrichosporon cavernicola]BEI97086.1 hypothetical protein CcaverHIS631_0206750 [Cutaneotrichosporon cavernicola]BEJ04859.1 hypothetical protein CcaverHIS641_0206760 [Cutaneotrichosporon cavernicola]
MDPSRRNHLGVHMPRDPSPVPPYDLPISPGGYMSPPGARSALSPLPPPRNSVPPSPYASTPPRYAPLPPSAPSTMAPSTFAPTQVSRSSSVLPHFEAALARARGETPPVPPPITSTNYTPHAIPQPVPSYLPPQDPNHPDLSVGFTQSHTIRMAQDSRYRREPSRSPSPGFDNSMRYNFGSGTDVEKALLSDIDRDDLLYGTHTGPTTPAPPRSLSYMATGEVVDTNGDLSLHGLGQLLPDRSSIYKAPLDGFESVPLVEGEEDPDTTQHFGPAPEGRVGRRTHNAIRKRIKQRLTLGDSDMLSVEMAIPSRLAQFLPVKGVEEQKTTRYTAVTTDPDGFAASGIRLRQNMFVPPRETELFVVITMYNEDANLFCRTLYGVMKNIAHMCGRKNSRVWGPNGWKKIVVCIVADGRKNVNPRVLDCLAALGVYQEGAMTNMVKEKPVTAHVFEYTTSFALDPDLHFKYPDKGIVPCQIIFCMKEKNAKKINSHRWFFNAFGPLLQPNVCILLDVGTMPGPKSLYHLWKSFDRHSNVGGACGEIATFKGRSWLGLLNPLVAAQCFEYKMSNILDKPMESLFGYCAVLPGAFSAYRYIALQNDEFGRGPLASYFAGESIHSGNADSFTGNMYLAEDRVLCFEIVAKPNNNWVLKYVKSAVGETDCPDTIPEFIGQRRRWLNGSFFAAVYALINFRQVWRSDHTFIRKSMFMVEWFYNGLNLVFGWFSLANFYIFFVILTNALNGPEFKIKGIRVLNDILQYIYLGTVISCFIFGMGNRPQGAPLKYKVAIYIFAILTFYMLVCGVLCIVEAVRQMDSPIFQRMIISLLATYGIFIVSSILALDPWHMFTCFLQYMLFQPTYVNVLNIYAFSNLHDLSWGTKGSDMVESDLGAAKGVGKDVEVHLVSSQHDIDNAYQDALDNIRVKRARVDADEMPHKSDAKEQKQKDTYANFRTNLLLFWSLTNALLAGMILSGDPVDAFSGGGTNKQAVYMLVILVFVAGMAAFRFTCATLYLIIRLFVG